MDISRLTPEELQRLTPEERQHFTPEQRAAALEVLDPDLRLPPDEQRRREAAWMLADVTAWHAIATSCVRHVVESYRCGDIDMGQGIEAMHRATIGCWAQDRVYLVGLFASRAHRTTVLKRAPGQRAPKWPLWVQNTTAMLVLEGRPAIQNFAGPRCRRTHAPTKMTSRE